MHTRRLRAGILLAALAGALVALPAAPASADVIPQTVYPPVELTGMASPNYLLSQPDGGVTVGCGSGTRALRLSAAGTLTHTLANADPYVQVCGRKSAVTADGTLVTAATNGTGWPRLVAVKDGAVVWTHVFACQYTITKGVVVGTNGNVYALTWCNGQDTVTGFEPAPAPGNTTPTVVLSANTASAIDGGIAAYSGGLVVRTTTGLQYISYGGTVHQPFTVANVLNNNAAEYFDATLAGRIAVVAQASAPSVQFCGNDTWTAGSIYAYEPSGAAWAYNSLPACSHVYELRPTPTGGFVVHYDSPQSVLGSPRVHKLLALDANGDQLWVADLMPATAGQANVTATYAVDLNGNVAVQRWVEYQANGWWHKALRMALLSGFSGGTLATYELKADPMGSGQGYNASTDISLGENVWYVVAADCVNGNNCSSGAPKLYAVSVPGVQVEYPRGAILSPPGGAPLDYVAMGDSFSSGEGLPGFDAGTDTAGPPENRCHRSTTGAYARLLDATPSLNLNLTDFVACSGATTEQVTGTWPAGGSNTNEAAQVDALSASTDVVTITIGGNDIGFKNFVIDCLFSDCSNTLVNQPYFANIANLGLALDRTFVGDQTTDGIRDRAPNAKVYAIGYPQLLPSQGCSQTDGWMAALNELMLSAHNGNAAAIDLVVAIGYAGNIPDTKIYEAIAAGVVEFSSAETATVRSLVTELNAAIADAVAVINQPWLTYINPFASGSLFVGHELCTTQPFFHGLDVVNIEHSYHPNSMGQEAYQNLVSQHLVS